MGGQTEQDEIAARDQESCKPGGNEESIERESLGGHSPVEEVLKAL
jgi:hypothetical protein